MTPGFCPSICQSLTLCCPGEKGITFPDDPPGIFRTGGSHLVKDRCLQTYTGVIYQHPTLPAARDWVTPSIGDRGRPPTVYHRGLKLTQARCFILTDFHIRNIIFESSVYISRKERNRTTDTKLFIKISDRLSCVFLSFILTTMNMH